jgi:hypothetical protein
LYLIYLQLCTPRSIEAITAEILELEKETEAIIKEIVRN